MLRVLTLNVWNREGPWETRRELLRAWLRRLQPDLIGLQEAKDPAQAQDLVGEEYEVAWMGNEISGIAVASRWPLRDRAQLALEGDGPEAGGAALRALVDSPHGAISFCCATTFFYLPSHGFKRERQMPQLAQFARGGAERGGFPPILVGDLNADDDSAEIRYLKGRQSLAGTSAYFVDAWEFGGDRGPGITWSRANGFADVWHLGDLRLDYIFVGHPRLPDGAGRVEHCEVVCNTAEGGVWPSDHFGVFAALRT